MSYSPIVLGFGRSRFACGDNTDDAFRFAMAMTNQKQAQPKTQTQKQKTVFPLGMHVVIELDGVFVAEYGPRLFEGDAMFIEVCPSLLRIPNETQFFHNYIVTTSVQFVK